MRKYTVTAPLEPLGCYGADFGGLRRMFQPAAVGLRGKLASRINPGREAPSTAQQDVRSQRLAILKYTRKHDFRIDDDAGSTS